MTTSCFSFDCLYCFKTLSTPLIHTDLYVCVCECVCVCVCVWRTCHLVRFFCCSSPLGSDVVLGMSCSLCSVWVLPFTMTDGTVFSFWMLQTIQSIYHAIFFSILGISFVQINTLQSARLPLTRPWSWRRLVLSAGCSSGLTQRRI